MKVEVTVRGIGASYKDKIIFQSNRRGLPNVYVVVDGKKYEFNAGSLVEAIRRCLDTVGVAHNPFD